MTLVKSAGRHWLWLAERKEKSTYTGLALYAKKACRRKGCGRRDRRNGSLGTGSIAT